MMMVDMWSSFNDVIRWICYTAYRYLTGRVRREDMKLAATQLERIFCHLRRKCAASVVVAAAAAAAVVYAVGIIGGVIHVLLSPEHTSYLVMGNFVLVCYPSSFHPNLTQKKKKHKQLLLMTTIFL